MPTLTQNNQATFVIRAYRECIPPNTRSALKRKILSLAAQKGRYIRLFKNDDSSTTAVFSHEGGYLLGESVMQYFHQARYLIFCETLDTSNKLLLVIIKDHRIHFDEIIPPQRLREILLPIIRGQTPYHIYLSGKVPLSIDPHDESALVVFPKDLTEAFEYLEDPLFPRLTPLNALLLQPLPTALKSEGLARSLLFTMGAISLLLLNLVLLLFFSPISPFISPKPTVSNEHRSTITDASSILLPNLSMHIEQLLTLPGWYAAHLSWEPSQPLIIQLEPRGGEYNTLAAWAHHHHYQLSMHSSVRLVTQLPKLSIPLYSSPQSIRQQLLTLADTICQLNSDSTPMQISFDAHNAEDSLQIIDIQLNQISPLQLDLIGKKLTDYPLTVKSIHFNLHENTISGQLQLTLWEK